MNVVRNSRTGQWQNKNAQSRGHETCSSSFKYNESAGYADKRPLIRFLPVSKLRKGFQQQNFKLCAPIL